MRQFPQEVADFLHATSVEPKVKTASAGFTSNICGNEWDRFIEDSANKAYAFVGRALGPYQTEPLREIFALDDADHSAGANASFASNGRIRLSPSVVDGNPGITLEKITHELIHASLASFPEGDSFYEEGYVDYSTWTLAHAPVWGQYRAAMVQAADFNIQCRRDRALRTQTDYDRKRWAGGVFCAMAYGPWIISTLRNRKDEGKLVW